MGSGFRGDSQVARQRELGLFHAVRIGEARQGLAASLVIFWAFLGILASAAGRATGRLIARVDLEHALLASYRKTRTDSASVGAGR